MVSRLIVTCPSLEPTGAGGLMSVTKIVTLVCAGIASTTEISKVPGPCEKLPVFERYPAGWLVMLSTPSPVRVSLRPVIVIFAPVGTGTLTANEASS